MIALAPMDTAPKDGAVIYVLFDGDEAAYPMYWGRRQHLPQSAEQWRMVWDWDAPSMCEAVGWHAVPKYSKPNATQEKAA